MRFCDVAACVAALFLAGCLPYYDRADMAVTRVARRGGGPPEVETTTYRSRAFGLSPIGAVPYGGYGGGCSDLHPENCTQTVVAYVYRPAMPIVSRVPTTAPAPSVASRPAARAHDEEASRRLSELLQKQERAIAALVGESRVTTVQLCRLILASPSVLDEDEREETLRGCGELVQRHAAKKKASTVAPPGAGRKE